MYSRSFCFALTVLGCFHIQYAAFSPFDSYSGMFLLWWISFRQVIIQRLHLVVEQNGQSKSEMVLVQFQSSYRIICLYWENKPYCVFWVVRNNLVSCYTEQQSANWAKDRLLCAGYMLSMLGLYRFVHAFGKGLFTICYCCISDQWIKEQSRFQSFKVGFMSRFSNIHTP